MSEILRQLAWASRVSGVRIDSITPSAPVASTGAQAVPIALSVEGRYFRLAKFMNLLRRQAGVKDGKVHASGRLYAIDNVSFSSGDKGGVITATLALNAFVYGSAPTPAPGSAQAPPRRAPRRRRRRRWPRWRQQAPRVGEQRADRCEAAAPEDLRRRARCRARRAARVRGSAPAEAEQLVGGAAAPTASSATPTAHGAKRFRGSGSGADPFAVKSLPNGDARAAAAGGPDPFTGPASSAAESTPARLPKQIVIGRPGGNRVAKRGWIVILASIPTNNGRGAASRFARSARGNVGALSVLNSSNRRPLRGGYWVVYSGPYSTLAAVSRRAGGIHAAGYRTAYIRELIAYR